MYIISIHSIYTLTSAKGGLFLNIIISQTNGSPIYQQIIEQIKTQILSGKLKPNDPLPSMRLLAKELRVSLITTKRAYEELERSGYIYTVLGKGSFVSAENHESFFDEQLEQITSELNNVVKRAKLNNISVEKLNELLYELYEKG